MYTVDQFDEVQVLEGLPSHSAGAPMPVILANDHALILAYETAPDGADYAIVKFLSPRAHYFGAPNDETLRGHPLAARGLGHYGIYEIRHSSWIRTLDRVNSVHPRHNASRFQKLRHFVFTFHDATLECVAEGITLVGRLPNTVENSKTLLTEMAAELR